MGEVQKEDIEVELLDLHKRTDIFWSAKCFNNFASGVPI